MSREDVIKVKLKGYKIKLLKTITVIEFVELISGIKNNLKECYKKQFLEK